MLRQVGEVFVLVVTEFGLQQGRAGTQIVWLSRYGTVRYLTGRDRTGRLRRVIPGPFGAKQVTFKRLSVIKLL